jgi:hypothetical protein
MVIGHDDPAILAHLWAAAAGAWANTANTSFNLPYMNQTPAVTSMSLPTVSQVQPAPNKTQELHRDQARTFAGVVLPKVPQVQLGGNGEMPSVVARLSQQMEASDNVNIEMSTPVTSKVNKGKGRLIKVDLAADQGHLLKKRKIENVSGKIENVSGKTSGPKLSMKKRDIMSTEPDKGLVTPLASRSMLARAAMANNRIQDAMHVGKLPGRDDGSSVSAMWHSICRLVNGHSVQCPTAPLGGIGYRQMIARWNHLHMQPRWRISMYL